MDKQVKINKQDLIKSKILEKKLVKENINPKTASKHVINNYDDAYGFIKEAEKNGIKPGLTNIRNLCGKIDDVQNKLDIIHIAGTNGKGSVAAFLTSIFEKCGIKVGRYTSPAVFEYRERFYVSNSEDKTINKSDSFISEDDFTKEISFIAEKVDELINEGKDAPTAFEIETALAFDYFYKSGCEIVILECGMGGRMDATNIIMRPVLTILTKISMDHMNFLGESITDIANEKAGIIKYGVPIVSAPQDEEVRKVLEKKAKDRFNAVSYADEYDGDIGLLGSFQRENAGIAFEAAGIVLAGILGNDILNMKNEIDLKIREGIKEAIHPGRFQRIETKRDIYIDGAHNEDAIKKLCKSVGMYFTKRPVIIIIGVLSDKEHKKMCDMLLNVASSIFAVAPNNKRALGEVDLYNELCDSLDELNKSTEDKKISLSHGSFEEVARTSIKEYDEYCNKGEKPVILACGSLSYLNDIVKRFLEIERN